MPSAHGDNYRWRQARGFCEEVKVTQSKGELHLLPQSNDHLFLLFVGRAGIWTKQDCAFTKVTRDGKADTILWSLDDTGVAENLHVADDTLEFGGGQTDVPVLIGARNIQLFRGDIHPLELCRRTHIERTGSISTKQRAEFEFIYYNFIFTDNKTDNTII